ncbi:peptidoglycan/xylan/chitin deacetylase (PgdA/CDA1 family) [Barrientosiimonas humi]|uniref:Peptidoglycan/xylan/chitin deacetylase (PgdA/CDA1 family) n=1 Tax=Barrientosiimonas humi TaxID=999931 RepID=A0A542XFM4_9MICO|nr:polysaccharide deacetylase family protein [Barrientosiimonas humi]TQL34622.1 peptidoglycan/xylan/chitin deacetylase (PgdA/CDA1 family) [Barrientosiimonas humi]CAG7574612.1 Peptidoglycan-N-acetylglucosamine deacetylase [Barrientosiimonas humi]
MLHRPRRQGLLAGLTALTLLASAACTADTPDPAGSTSSTGPTTTPGTGSTTGPGTPSPTPLTPGDPLPNLPAELTPGVSDDAVTDQTYRISLSVPRIPQTPGLTRWLVGQRDRTASTFRSDYGPAKSPTSAELNGDWRLIGASPQVVGVRLSRMELSGASTVDLDTFVWWDVAAGRRIPARGLVRGDAWSRLSAEVTRRLGERADPDDLKARLAEPEAPEGAGPAIAFLRDGRMWVGFEPGEVAPYSEGAVSVVLPRAVGDALLSEQGSAARDAAVKPTAVGRPTTSTTAPPTTPTPSTTARPVDCTVERCVALTYDDGPGAHTERLLSTLRSKGARATFFMLGEQASRYPEVVQSVKNAGMEIGSHSWGHEQLTAMTPGALRSDLSRTNQTLSQLTGTPVRLVRPPYGARTAQVDKVSGELGMAEVLWDVDTLDWKYRDPGRLPKDATSAVRPGSIVLMHDIHRSTVDGAPALIDALQKKGYTLVTVSELLGSTQAGKTYSRR